MSSQCFLEITNEDIYTKLCALGDGVVSTKSKIKVNSWIATTALTLSIVLIGVLVSPMAGAAFMGVCFTY